MGLLDNLVAYWKLDEASGTRIDSAGTSNLTDTNTVTQATGKVNFAAQFTSANAESLGITDNPALSAGNIDFSITCWVYFDTKTADMDIVTKWSSVGDKEYLLTFDVVANRLAFWVSSDGTATNNVNANNFGSPPTSTWMYIYAYHDSVNDLIGISVNNGTDDTVAHATGINNGTASFILGSRAAGGIFMNGRIDEVAIRKGLLNTQDRAASYNGGAGTTFPFSFPSVLKKNLRPRIFAPGIAR